MKSKETDNVVITLPRKNWELLYQTLEMDSHSAVFDSDLRAEIRDALCDIRDFTQETQNLLDAAEMVPRTATATFGSVRAHFISEDLIEELDNAISFFRSPFEFRGGKRKYSRKLV